MMKQHTKRLKLSVLIQDFPAHQYGGTWDDHGTLLQATYGSSQNVNCYPAELKEYAVPQNLSGVTKD